MSKLNRKTIFIATTALTIITSCYFNLPSFAEDTPTTAETTQILAPQGLTDKEKINLEKQYRFEYRNKQMLLEPYTPSASGQTSETNEIKAINEEEKLYRYFGIASELYKSGKLEESIEILKYILTRSPDDDYVKNYLKKVEDQLKIQKAGWEKINKKDAQALKRNEIKQLLRDGTSYYDQRDYDSALLKFVDVLGMEPENKVAKKYIGKLKEYYGQEIKADKIAGRWQPTDSTKEVTSPSEELKPVQEAIVAVNGKQTTTNEKVKETAPAASKIPSPSFESATKGLRASDYSGIFNYYMEQAKENAKNGEMKEAYRSCKMIFLSVPMDEETKSSILSEIEDIGARNNKT